MGELTRYDRANWRPEVMLFINFGRLLIELKKSSEAKAADVIIQAIGYTLIDNVLSGQLIECCSVFLKKHYCKFRALYDPDQ